MRRYVDVRLDLYRAGGNKDLVAAAVKQSRRLQNELWKHGSAAARADARSVPVGLFLQSLNETIDLDAKRLAAMENHVPETVWALVLIVAVLGTLTIGYGSGLGGRRVGLPMFVTPLLIAAVITLIIDMDRPRRGLIRVSQESMFRLKSNYTEELKSP